MKKLFIIIFTIFLFLPIASKAFAQETPNNKVGIHILFPSEIEKAAEIVNSNNGDWGYVTIPIQSGDKDLKKWQGFMDRAKALHVIPIIRLATEGDYFNTNVWRKPTFNDVLDFANFLGSLNWPVKNKYIIVYNEVNRNNEWGGNVSPSEYAQILSYAVTSFKSKSKDFYIISAGLDNGAANSSSAMDEYNFLSQMQSSVPGIFGQIDGLGSHSYPNPAFSASPLSNSKKGISSFRFEDQLVSGFTSKKLPIFITETGWSKQNLSDNTIASYLKTAFQQVWNDNSIVAVTPFLLEADTPPFDQFSILGKGGVDTALSTALRDILKLKGQPFIAPEVLAAEVNNNNNLPVKNFSKETEKENIILIAIKKIINFFRKS